MLIQMQLNVGDLAPDIVLTSTQSAGIRLSTLCNDKNVLLVFLRHFG